MYLTGMRHDLEYKIQLINTARLNLMNEMNSMTANGADLDPESPEVKILEQRRQRLMLIDKKLEMEQQQYQTQLQMVQAEDQTVSRGLQQNIERAYSNR
jgi:uncharacterized protein (DUF3084 family)